MALTIPLQTVMAILNWRKVLTDWGYSVRFCVFGAGAVAVWMLAHYDPGHVWLWFFD